MPQDGGIYYIIKKGTDVKKDLAIQVVAQEGDLLLQALDKKALDAATTDKVAEFMLTAGKDNTDTLGYWFKALAPENIKIISERMREDMLASEKAYLEVMESWGLSDRLRQEGWQKGKQEGWQKGKQEGKLEGWQEGLEEEKRRTARAMLADGMDVNTIARITGLTIGEIANL